MPQRKRPGDVPPVEWRSTPAIAASAVPIEQSDEPDRRPLNKLHSGAGPETGSVHLANSASAHAGAEEKAEDDDGPDRLVDRCAVRPARRRKDKRDDMLAAPENEEAEDDGDGQNGSGKIQVLPLIASPASARRTTSRCEACTRAGPGRPPRQDTGRPR